MSAHLKELNYIQPTLTSFKFRNEGLGSTQSVRHLRLGETGCISPFN